MESRDVAVDLNQRVVRLGGTAHTAVELVSDGGLVLLAMTVLVVARQARRRGARAFATVVSGSLGTVAALAGSELLKAVHAQQRPCQAMPAVEPLVACPPPGDWSLPSNHAVLAAAAATVIVLTAPGLWRLVVPLAVAVAASRVAAGVHYPHDVMDGLLLGAVIVLIAVLAITRPVERLLRLVCAAFRGVRMLGSRPR
jgi:undecaprenyl-diphosphatase